MDYSNHINQQIVEKLVEREVKHCVSYLISHLLEVVPDDERLMDLSQRKNWDYQFEQVPEAKWLDLASNNDLDFTTKEAVIAKLGEDECGDQLGLDPDYDDVYEHWLVTGWALEKLRGLGEVVCEDLHGLNVWGRCTTGQSISLDQVWWKIAKDMEILQGMANSWEGRV